MPKTKITTEREVSDELRNIGQDLIGEFCPTLRDASIVFLMQTRINDDTGKAVLPRVNEKYGTARAMSLFHRMLHHEDFWIIISGNWWAKLDDRQKRAMLYRHLCACDMHNGKPILQKPDFVGYQSEIKHFGAWSAELGAAQEILAPQLSLEYLGEEEPAAEAAVAAVPITEAPAAEERADPFGDDDGEEAVAPVVSDLLAAVEHAAQ